MAKNKSPACAFRESVQTFLTMVSAAPRRISPSQASATNFKERVSTAIHFNKNVAETTAVMVLSSELVSFSPPLLVSVSCNGVI